ncbi:hypothetical protein IFR05_017329, partial [Cadophora sp. M221]
AEWIQMQDDYADAREKKLDTLYRAEILHDIDMLKKPWTDENGGPSTDIDPFVPETQANLAVENRYLMTQEHTLGWLDLIEELVVSGDLFQIQYLRGWEDDQVPETPQLKELIRLLDEKGTGANDDDQPCFVFSGDSQMGQRWGEDARKVLLLSLAYLALELDEVPHEPEFAQQNLPAFADINFLYRQILRAVNGIADGVHFETRPGIYSMEDTVSFNTTPGRIAEIVDRNLQPVLGRCHFCSDLRELNEDFNNRMNVEYVEDVLTNKLVVVTDEEYDIMNDLRLYGDRLVPANLQNPSYPDLSREKMEQYKKPQQYICKMAQVAQLRRNLLLLKDWNRKRPWKQLYCPYNTSEDGDYSPNSTDSRRRNFLEFIKHFQTHLKAIHLATPQAIPKNIRYNRDFNPSNEANVYSNLFPIHPLASTLIPAVNDADYALY